VRDERPIIVKLGGSILTRKRAHSHLRPKLLSRLAREVAGASTPVVLLHGAGSFGHPEAKRWGLAESPAAGVRPGERARGAAIVAREVRRLHSAVLAAVAEHGASPWSVPAATISFQTGGRLSRFDDRPVREALERDLTPVSFGDVVPDSEWGFSILSADTIALELGGRLGARRVLFVGDVDGIYDPDAPNDRRVVESVTPELAKKLATTGRGPDVTGGIRGKANAMLAIAALGIDAALISGLKDGTLSRALAGETVYGSWAKAAPP
jgi:isopentenyl phosphate kinase